MIAKKILSAQHPEVKRLVRLRNESSARKEFQEILLVGEKIVREAAQKGLIKTLICLESPRWHVGESYLVTPEILKKITGVQAPDGFAAVVPFPNFENFEQKSRLLLLDQISDPGNLGSLIRSSVAFGWDGAFLTEGTVDPFNDKAIRASRGFSVFFPTKTISSENLKNFLNHKTHDFWIADTEGALLSTLPSPNHLLLALCNEGSGPSSLIEPFGKKITIAHSSKVESLGVSAAGAILLHHFGRRA